MFSLMEICEQCDMFVDEPPLNWVTEVCTELDRRQKEWLASIKSKRQDVPHDAANDGEVI